MHGCGQPKLRIPTRNRGPRFLCELTDLFKPRYLNDHTLNGTPESVFLLVSWHLILSAALDPQRATEAASAIIRFCSVVINEDMIVTTITKESTTELSDIRRCFDPARCFQIELSKFL